jgi:hypothetical protein
MSVQKRFLLMSLILLLLGWPLALTHAQGKNEPKEGYPALTPGETLQDSFTSTVTAKLYTINASEGDLVSIQMTQITETLDPYLVLIGPNGQVIASDDDSGTAQMFSASITDAAIPADGQYWVLATSFLYIDTILVDAGEEVIPEEFELLATGFSNDDAIEADNEFTALVANETVMGETDSESKIDLYTFEGSEGDVVSLSMNSDDFSTILHVFDAQGQRVAVSLDVDVFSDAITDLTLPTDGAYLVFATDTFFYDAAFTSGGAYELLLTAP